MTAVGCFIWGIMTGAAALCTALSQAIACWAVNGLGLALVIPSGQSLIADFYSPAARGTAFGTLYLTGALGGMLGGLYATNVGEHAAFWVHGIHGFELGIGELRCIFLAQPAQKTTIGLFGCQICCRTHPRNAGRAGS